MNTGEYIMYPRYTKDEKESLREIKRGIAKAKYSMAHQHPNDACKLTNIKVCKRIIFDLGYAEWKIRQEHKQKVKRWRQEKIGHMKHWIKTLTTNIYTVFYNFYITLLVKFYR